MVKKNTARLTDIQRNDIRNAPAGMSLSDLAKRFNVAPQTIAYYRNGAKRAPAKQAAATLAKPTENRVLNQSEMISRLDFARTILRNSKELTSDQRLVMVEAALA